VRFFPSLLSCPESYALISITGASVQHLVSKRIDGVSEGPVRNYRAPLTSYVRLAKCRLKS
jgi:hypothetical protein